MSVAALAALWFIAAPSELLPVRGAIEGGAAAVLSTTSTGAIAPAVVGFVRASLSGSVASDLARAPWLRFTYAALELRGGTLGASGGTEAVVVETVELRLGLSVGAQYAFRLSEALELVPQLGVGYDAAIVSIRTRVNDQRTGSTGLVSAVGAGPGLVLAGPSWSVALRTWLTHAPSLADLDVFLGAGFGWVWR